MSKLIKSQHCIEAHPCRLDPVDVDAFFINDQEQEELPSSSQSETETETAATSEGFWETFHHPNEESAVEADEAIGANPEDTEVSAKETTETKENETETTKPVTNSPQVDLFHINLEAEKLIDQSKREADVLTRLAQEKAESITGTAQEEAAGIIEQAKAEGDRVKAQAESDAKAIIEKAQQQAAETINQAKQEAEKLVNEARQQAENLKAEAQQAGTAAGYQEGLAKAKAEIAGNLSNSFQLLAEAEEERTRRIASSEGELLKLVTGIAEKIISSELKSSPEQLLSIVREGLSRAVTANSITVKINPEELELIQKNLPSLQEVFSEPKVIQVKADQTILPGDCFIETEHGKVDARVKGQLERIMSEILKVGHINEPS